MKKSELKSSNQSKAAGSTSKASGSHRGSCSYWTWKKRIKAALITILLLLGVLFFTAAEFSPIQTVSVEDTVGEQPHIAQAVYKTTSQLNRAVSNRQESFTVKFTPEEVNAILMTTLMVVQSKNSADTPMIFGKWQDGRLHVEASYKKSGVYFTLRCIAQILIKDNDFQIKISDSTLGSLPVPSSIIEEQAAEAIKKLKSQKKAQLIFEAIRSFSTDPEGNAVIELDTKLAPAVLFSLF